LAATENQFGDDEAGIERGTDGKRPAETFGHMAVPGMIMRVGVVVMMMVVRHAAVITRGNANTITAKLRSVPQLRAAGEQVGECQRAAA
jgi:hypothetical protein